MIKLRRQNRTFILTIIEKDGIRELSFPIPESVAVYCEKMGIK